MICIFITFFRYLWADGSSYKKPTALPAPKYIELLMDWIESQINNEDLFPVTTGKYALITNMKYDVIQYGFDVSKHTI